MFRKNGRVLVAVSGGADSLACLWVLLHLRSQFGFEIVVAHFDHQLRPDSKADMEFVRDLCERLELPCRTGEGDVAHAAMESGRGVEEAARQMRYQFLGFIAANERCESVATGHTADDQAETVLQRVLRGTGVRGVRGMVPVAPLPGNAALNVVRPLLEVSRAETEAICREAGLEPRADDSNSDVRYQRNRIRHEVLPALRAITPGVDDSLRGLASAARELFALTERRALEVQPSSRTHEGVIFETKALRGLPAESLTLVLEREAAFFKDTIEMQRTRLENLQAVLRAGTGRVPVGPRLHVEASCGLVRLGHPLPVTAPVEPRILNVPGSTLAGEWRVDVRTSPVEGAIIVPTAAVSGVLRIRTSQPGDRITLRGVRRRLSDALLEARVPAWQRHDLLVLAAGANVVAVPSVPALVPAPGDRDDSILAITISRIDRR